MRVRLVTVVALALLALAWAAPAHAENAVHLNDAIDESFSFTYLSPSCGFEVTITVEAFEDVTLVYDRDGLVVRELDHSSGGTLTYGSAYNSVTTPMAWDFNITYPGGAPLGSTASAVISGVCNGPLLPQYIQPRITGYVPPPAGSGREVNLVVIGFLDNGIPELSFGDFVASHGNDVSHFDFDSAFCEALGPNHH
jgi:hypothetical protein